MHPLLICSPSQVPCASPCLCSTCKTPTEGGAPSCSHRPHHSLHVTSTCLHLALITVHLRSVYFSLPGCVYLNIRYYNLSSRIPRRAHRCLFEACTAGTAAPHRSKSTATDRNIAHVLVCSAEASTTAVLLLVECTAATCYPEQSCMCFLMIDNLGAGTTSTPLRLTQRSPHHTTCSHHLPLAP